MIENDQLTGKFQLRVKRTFQSPMRVTLTPVGQPVNGVHFYTLDAVAGSELTTKVGAAIAPVPGTNRFKYTITQTYDGTQVSQPYPQGIVAHQPPDNAWPKSDG